LNLLEQYQTAIARKHVAENLARLAYNTTSPAKWRQAARALRLAADTLPNLVMMAPLVLNWIGVAHRWQGRADRLAQAHHLAQSPGGTIKLDQPTFIASCSK
jgi:hypothetical protein